MSVSPPNRRIRMLILYAAVCLAASTALFVLKPGGLIGLCAAIALGLVTVELLWIAFFPAQVRRILRGTEEEVGKEPRPTNLGGGSPSWRKIPISLNDRSWGSRQLSEKMRLYTSGKLALGSHPCCNCFQADPRHAHPPHSTRRRSTMGHCL
jgi:hypothetical protein